jgi:nucleoside 2-deoxyribosyltransferase
MKIYFAGPLFTPYERDYISKCAVTLREAGIDPFVPHEQPWGAPPDDPRTPAKRCFDKDFGGILAANAVLAILNGTEVDDGTACEIGIFSELMKTDPTKKGIVTLHEDYRTKINGEGKGLNGFVAGCIEKSGLITDTLEEAIQQLKAWEAELVAAGTLEERKVAS